MTRNKANYNFLLGIKMFSGKGSCPIETLKIIKNF